MLSSGGEGQQHVIHYSYANMNKIWTQCQSSSKMTTQNVKTKCTDLIFHYKFIRDRYTQKTMMANSLTCTSPMRITGKLMEIE